MHGGWARAVHVRPQDARRGNPQLEVVGQIVKDLAPETLAATRPEVPWARIAGARSILANQYLGVDLSLIWNIVEGDLEALEVAVGQLIEK